MAITNKTKYAILGVLCIKSCSGYDIKKFCDKSIAHFWNENFGHIYPVLKQLSEENLIRPEEKSPNERRKIYSITDAGRKEFYDWLAQPPQLQPPRSELLLKLCFGNHMPKEQVIHMLEEVKLRNSSNLEQYKLMEAGYLNDAAAKKDPAYPYFLASLRYGILNAEAVLHWCEDTKNLIMEA